jgi:hypothetical protein
MTWKRDLLNFYVAEWRQVAAVIATAGALGIGACATVPGSMSLTKDTPPEAKQAAVTKRALERWDALLKGDTKTAYGFLSPASREVTPLERFQAKMSAAAFRAIKPESTSCEAESCRVKLWLTFDHRVMPGVTVPIEETWVIADGQAWLVYRE